MCLCHLPMLIHDKPDWHLLASRMPQICNQARGYILEDEDFTKQGMELNKFYSRYEIMSMGFQRA